MTITAIVPAIVCIGGLVGWLLVERLKPIAIWMFACGLLVWLFVLADKTVKL